MNFHKFWFENRRWKNFAKMAKLGGLPVRIFNDNISLLVTNYGR